MEHICNIVKDFIITETAEYLSEMEEQLPFGIKYIQCGKTDSILYSTVKDIPGLGTLREKHNEISYLIMRCDDEAVRNKFGQVYPGENGRSLEFDPSGISEDGTGLIHGMFATMEDNEMSDGLCFQPTSG